MKIFILNPNFSLEKDSLMGARKRQPLSLAIIAAMLRDCGHQVAFLDANADNLSNNEVLSRVDDFNPESIIATSSPVDRWECPSLKIDNIIKLFRRLNVKNKILTGSHGSTMPEWVLNRSNVDYVVREEPEVTTVNLIGLLREGRSVSGLNGVSYRRDNKIINSPGAKRIVELDSLPFPAYDLLPMQKYSASGYQKPFSIMLTSRGCPYNCLFCLKVMSDGACTFQTPNRVIMELKHLLSRFGVKSVYFQDWEFLINQKRVEKICDLIIDNNLNFTWGCNARAGDIVRCPDLLMKMKRAGCVKVNMGLESANDEILVNINKQTTKSELQEAIKILKSCQIDCGYYTLLNCPGESPETISETIKFILDNKLKIGSFNLVVPYPGTKLFEINRDKFNKDKIDWDNISDYVGRVNSSLTPRQAQFYLRHLKYRIQYGPVYFIRPNFIKAMIKRFI